MGTPKPTKPVSPKNGPYVASQPYQMQRLRNVFYNFSGPKICLNEKYFGPNIFSDKKFWGANNFFGPTYFWT